MKNRQRNYCLFRRDQTMNERALRVLEFTKIRDMLASYALSDPGKQMCR